MTNDKKETRKAYFSQIDRMTAEDAKGLLKALIWNNVGRTIGLVEAVHMTGGSRVYLDRMLAAGAIKETGKAAGNCKRHISLCDCLMNASIETLR